MLIEKLYFSLIIPVYNRPNEIDELLQSIVNQDIDFDFEVIVVEDGSSISCKNITATYTEKLNLIYLSKPNSGAGLSRNFGMQKAHGNYFIILDSDVLLPPHYLKTVHAKLLETFTDTFGGPDAADVRFSPTQKAINFAMTSFWTTGGLRGGKTNKDFQPRSFNMGLSKKVFEQTQGFSPRKIGEDIDLSFRIKNLGFTSQLIPEAYVYHKRRSTYKQFFFQTFTFGKERPLLNREFPKTAKLTYWFPSFFTLGIFLALTLALLECYFGLLLLGLYLFVIFINASINYKSLYVGLLSIWATFVQFTGYGVGFLYSILKKRPTSVGL